MAQQPKLSTTASDITKPRENFSRLRRKVVRLWGVFVRLVKGENDKLSEEDVRALITTKPSRETTTTESNISRRGNPFLYFSIYTEDCELGNDLTLKTVWIARPGGKSTPASGFGKDVQAKFNNGVSFHTIRAESVFGVGKAGQVLVDFTGNPESLEVVRRWIQDREGKHLRWCSEHREDWMPTRVVEVLGWEGGDDGEESCSFRIEIPEKEEEGFSAPYFTLSHCWSGVVPFQLTKGNLMDLRAGRRVQKLPLTFHHAIQVCRFLNVRHIWIDSLCIIQDDIADWQYEAQRMGRVYAKGLCNLSADCAENSSEGLFRQRNAAQVEPIVYDVPATSPLGVPAGLYDFSTITRWAASESMMCRLIAVRGCFKNDCFLGRWCISCRIG